ncbi:hypothetical protein AMECASPLE_018031, partial [Ameca splendens]
MEFLVQECVRSRRRLVLLIGGGLVRWRADRVFILGLEAQSVTQIRRHGIRGGFNLSLTVKEDGPGTAFRDQRLSSNISSATSGTDRSKMQRCFGVFCVSLILCATLSETIGLVIAAKERRGWTLNSAGYLLGPRRIDHLIQIKDSPSARGRDELVTQYGIDGHRTLGDKVGLAGKRDMGQEEDIRT